MNCWAHAEADVSERLFSMSLSWFKNSCLFRVSINFSSETCPMYVSFTNSVNCGLSSRFMGSILSTSSYSSSPE